MGCASIRSWRATSPGCRDAGPLVIDSAACSSIARGSRSPAGSLRAGQVIEVNLGGVLDRAAARGRRPRRARSRRRRCRRTTIMFEDDDVVVVDKPAGLVTAPTPESDRGNLADLLDRRAAAPAARCIVVHRIDRPTSGLLVFAKTDLANRALGRRVRGARRRARVPRRRGRRHSPPRRPIDRPIGGSRAVTHDRDRRAARRRDRSSRAGSRPGARTRSGSTSPALGHPIAGDQQHGGGRARTFSPRPPRLALHAASSGSSTRGPGRRCASSAGCRPDLDAWIDELRGGARAVVERYCFVKLRDEEVAGRERLAAESRAMLAAIARRGRRTVGTPADDERRALGPRDRHPVRRPRGVGPGRGPAVAALLDDGCPARAAMIKAWTFEIG